MSRGTRVCAPAEEVADAPQPCSPTQIAPCIVDGTDYQAVALASLLATDIRDGVKIAGVEGKRLFDAPDCTSDGAIACRTTDDFPAIDKANVLLPAAVSLRNSLTLAGVTGTLPDCSTDGGSSCFATANFPAVDKSNKLTPETWPKFKAR